MYQISSLYVIRFDLQTLLKLTEDIQQKTPKKTKNSHKQVKSRNFKKQKNAFRMVHLRILHAKNQHPRPKTVAYRPRTHTKTAKNGLKIAVSRSNLKISKNKKKTVSNGTPKDPSCQKSAPQVKNCGLQAANRQTHRQTDRESKH